MRRTVRWLWWYVTELTGENAYHRYVERTQRRDPAVAVLSRREFERRRADARATEPGGGHGCC